MLSMLSRTCCQSRCSVQFGSSQLQRPRLACHTTVRAATLVRAGSQICVSGSQWLLQPFSGHFGMESQALPRRLSFANSGRNGLALAVASLTSCSVAAAGNMVTCEGPSSSAQAPTGVLSGKTVVITGAGKGIGRAIALSYIKEGATLVLAARTGNDLDDVAKECAKVAPADRVKMFPVDLSEPKGVEDLANFVLTACGGCDVLVNNAGRGSPGNAFDGDPDDWDRMMYLNLNGVIRLTRRLSPTMVQRKWGAIINLGSIAAIEGMSGTSAAYAASKHGLRGWNNSIYTGLRHENIKVVLINPAFVNTPMVAGIKNVIPERMIQPEDVAEVCLLPFKMSSGAVPSEVTLRLTLGAFKS